MHAYAWQCKARPWVFMNAYCCSEIITVGAEMTLAGNTIDDSSCEKVMSR